MAASVFTVSQDGTGDFQTVQEAIDAVPLGNSRRTVIRVSPGIYRQPVYVPKTKNFITLAGLCREDTVITWNNTATKIDHHQHARVIGTGTFGCGTTIVEGEDFIAENITFENSSPQGSGQAVAIRVTADRCAFYNCRFLGWQDTLYLHYGFITAQARKSSQETTGYVFLRCVITGNGGTSYAYLGRPWGPFGRVVFAYTYMDPCIRQVGWDNWGKVENERSACFYEYRCFGPGCCPTDRVGWCRELIDEEAEHFILHPFIDPEPDRSWLCQRMGLKIPYSA
ncbi:unnamed protein product [Lathyrus oleraceus]